MARCQIDRLTARKKDTNLQNMGKKYQPSIAELNQRRKRALQLINKGLTQAEAARDVGVSRQAMSVWVRHYKEGGWRGLRAKRPGRARILTAAQVKQLKTIVDRGPVNEGHIDGMWTAPRINKIIVRRFGVNATVTTVLNLIRTEHWSIPKRIRRRR